MCVSEKITITKQGELLTHEQIKKTNALVRNECCNNDNGNCEVMNFRKCLQTGSPFIICDWFNDAVIPLDTILVSELNPKDTTGLKKCAVCGKSFISISNRSRYCGKCGKKVKNAQKLESKKRISNGER